MNDDLKPNTGSLPEERAGSAGGNLPEDADLHMSGQSRARPKTSPLEGQPTAPEELLSGIREEMDQPGKEKPRRGSGWLKAATDRLRGVTGALREGETGSLRPEEAPSKSSRASDRSDTRPQHAFDIQPGSEAKLYGQGQLPEAKSRLAEMMQAKGGADEQGFFVSSDGEIRVLPVEPVQGGGTQPLARPKTGELPGELPVIEPKKATGGLREIIGGFLPDGDKVNTPPALSDEEIASRLSAGSGEAIGANWRKPPFVLETNGETGSDLDDRFTIYAEPESDALHLEDYLVEENKGFGQPAARRSEENIKPIGEVRQVDPKSADTARLDGDSLSDFLDEDRLAPPADGKAGTGPIRRKVPTGELKPPAREDSPAFDAAETQPPLEPLPPLDFPPPVNRKLSPRSLIPGVPPVNDDELPDWLRQPAAPPDVGEAKASTEEPIHSDETIRGGEDYSAEDSRAIEDNQVVEDNRDETIEIREEKVFLDTGNIGASRRGSFSQEETYPFDLREEITQNAGARTAPIDELEDFDIFSRLKTTPAEEQERLVPLAEKGGFTIYDPTVEGISDEIPAPEFPLPREPVETQAAPDLRALMDNEAEDPLFASRPASAPMQIVDYETRAPAAGAGGWFKRLSRSEKAVLFVLVFLLLSGVAAATMLVSRLVSNQRAAQQPALGTSAALEINMPHPVGLELTGGWNFDLGVGLLNASGQWEPQTAEWLAGSVVRRVVALPWNRQSEAVVQTLQAGDPIRLMIDNGRVEDFTVGQVKRVKVDQAELLEGHRASLVIILYQPDASERWVIECQP